MVTPSKYATRLSSRGGGAPPAPGDALNFDPPLSGPSYSRAAKAVLAVFLLGLLTFGLGVESWNALRAAPREVQWIVAAAGAAIAVNCWFIFTGHTVLDREGIRQSALWPKRVRWSEVRSARFIGVPFLAWCIPPRLMLRTQGGGFAMFNGGTPALHRAFAQVTVHFQSKPLRVPDA